jgi:hypothetical protein
MHKSTQAGSSEPVVRLLNDQIDLQAAARLSRTYLTWTYSALEEAVKKTPFSVVAIGMLAVAGGVAVAAQNRFAVTVPNGLSFSEVEGYDAWQTVAVSETQGSVKSILADPAMINAYKEGVPGNGRLFPEGSKIVKIEWSKKRNAESPYFVEVPDVLKTASFIVKDSRRFPNTHGWAYAQFAYDPASDSFNPTVTGAECGYACHTAVAAKDYIFTAYPKR